MQWFRAYTYSNDIDTVNVERVTKSSVWVVNKYKTMNPDAKARRCQRITSCDAYFEYRQEAIEWKRGLIQESIDKARMNLSYRVADMEKFRKETG